MQFRLVLDSAIGDESQSESPTKTSQIFLNVGSTMNKSIHDTSTIRSVGDETYDSNDMNVIGDEAEDVLNVSNNKASNDNNAIDGNDGSDGNSKRRSQMLSPTSKMVEALQYTKSIEESSIANASGIYEELEQTAMVLKQKSSEIQRKQTEQSQQIYRAQVKLSDEATAIANDVERRIRSEALELHKKFTLVSKRMKRDMKEFKKLTKHAFLNSSFGLCRCKTIG